MSEKITSLDQILATVKSEQQKYASGLWVPSLEKELRFTEITTSQQKRLIKSVVDSPVFNTEFIYTLRDILKENCMEDLDIDTLTLLDKLVIAIGLRATCIGSEVEIEVPAEEGKEAFTHTVDLIKLYEKIKEAKINVKADTFEKGVYKVVCDIPSIGTEYQLEKERRTTGANINIETTEELRDVLGEAFISEIVKYIKQVSVKQDEEFVEVDWTELTFEDRIKVVETFGMPLLKQVVEHINVLKKEFDKVEMIKFTRKKEPYERRLTIDGRFFTIS